MAATENYYAGGVDTGNITQIFWESIDEDDLNIDDAEFGKGLDPGGRDDAFDNHQINLLNWLFHILVNEHFTVFKF